MEMSLSFHFRLEKFWRSGVVPHSRYVRYPAPAIFFLHTKPIHPHLYALNNKLC